MILFNAYSYIFYGCGRCPKKTEMVQKHKYNKPIAAYMSLLCTLAILLVCVQILTAGGIQTPVKNDQLLLQVKKAFYSSITHRGQVFILHSPLNSVKNEDLTLFSSLFFSIVGLLMQIEFTSIPIFCAAEKARLAELAISSP